jgi:hypothetical protein
MPPAATRASGIGLISPMSTLVEATNTVKATRGTIKDVKDAKKLLAKDGWIEKGEPITLETLARILLAHSLNAKTTPETANVMTAVAFIITTNLQDGIAQGVADSVIELLKHSMATMTIDVRASLEQHASKLTETAQTQATIAQDMQKTQEDMAESARQAATQVRSYSQVTATNPTPPVHPAPPITHSQMQIQNRERIKKRQVLVDFKRTAEQQLEAMDEKTITRKAVNAIFMVYAAAADPKPSEIKLKSGTLLRNGGLLLELNSDEAAEWLRSEEVITSFLENVGSGASIKNRTYQVIVQFVPVGFDPADENDIRAYEEHNNIPAGSVAKAEWIKPIKDRKKDQKVATLRVYHRDAESANTILKQGAYVYNKRVVPKRPHREPIRCLRCHKFGHERRDCKYTNAYCGRCSLTHETEACSAKRDAYKCINCLGSHPSYDRECPAFWEKCQQMDQRCPENGLAYYPTEEQWTWVTLDHAATAQATPPIPDIPTRQPQPHPMLRQTQLSGTNTTPLGPPRHANAQASAPLDQ